MIRRAVVWALVAGAALLAVLSIAVARRGSGGDTDVPLYRVSSQPFLQRVTAEGNLVAARATPMIVPSAYRGGFRIAWIAPDAGEVRAGDVVIRLDPSDLEKTLKDAVADRAIAQLKMSKEEIVGAAEISNLDRDAAIASAELEVVREFERRDTQLYSRFEIIESEIDSELATRRHEYASESGVRRRSLARTEMELLGLERRQAELSIDQVREALGSLEVVAPHDGLLILERDWRGNPPRVGDTVFTGQRLAEIPDLSEMQAEVFVLEADAGGLRQAAQAEVVIEARPDDRYRAQVIQVEQMARPRLRNSPIQYFSVLLDLEATDPSVMSPGQRISATLIVAETNQALVVPWQAVVQKDGRHVVFRRQDGAWVEVPVTLGARSMGRVSVEEGLSDGDLIAIRDPDRMPGEPSPAVTERSPASPTPRADD